MAAQIGSTASYEDRQSISETVAVEAGRRRAGGTVAGDAREYVRYRADYVVAAALDREAARLAAAGSGEARAVSRGEGTRTTAGCDTPRGASGRLRQLHDRD